MSVQGAVDAWLERLEDEIQDEDRRARARLYVLGLKTKMCQAELALRRLSELEGKWNKSLIPGDPHGLKVRDQVYFCCDTFWTFLYSTLDVLAQFVNQAIRLEKDEKDVNFNKIHDELVRKDNGAAIQKAFEQCKGSQEFSDLAHYRNCSIHRRQIYHQEETVTVTDQTPGYEGWVTGPISWPRRVLCDNPLTVEATTRKRRVIPQYMQETKDKIAGHIEQILKSVVPVA